MRIINEGSHCFEIPVQVWKTKRIVQGFQFGVEILTTVALGREVPVALCPSDVNL